MTTTDNTEVLRQSLDSLDLAYPCNVLVLAPHPDDFDAIGITLKQLFDRQCEITLAVITGGANGVEAGYKGAQSDQQKEQLRQLEQRQSCGFFGLKNDSVRFLTPLFNADASLSVDETNTRLFKQLLKETSPQIVCLPFGNDSNMTHQRVYALYQRARRFIDDPHTALLNRDIKTRSMPHHLAIEFGATEAEWKRELLCHHDSQQQRNLNTRGIGFDERVLELNRTIAKDLHLEAEYAEAFAIEYHNP